MKAYFDIVGEMVGEFEFTKENINKAESLCDDYSGNYSNYILAIGWDIEKNQPVVYSDGPWEC